MPYTEIERRREASRRHYLKHKQDYIAAQSAKRKRMRLWYIQQKNNKPCSDCGERYPYYVMDYDHRDGVEKVADLNALMSNAAWQKVRDEIAKCDLVCSNCHRERTHHRRLALHASVAYIERTETGA